MEQEIQSAYQEELRQLESTAAEIRTQLEKLVEVPRYTGNDLTEQVLESVRDRRRRAFQMAEPEPYFGRLDFQEEGHGDPTPLYIGKVGIEDDDTGEIVVVDWRAPVASLFYSFTGGDNEVSYLSPDGTIAGLVYLKRNLVIRKQILQRVVDSFQRGGDNLGVTDEFLLHRLSENKNDRLRDIVSTIQEEQDQIIRSVKNSAIMIQGVAGSGKTTVALHRLAFLLYQYRETLQAERMIIFAPNRMFLDYISGVLPELGVGNIQQVTFIDWALELLEGEVSLVDPSTRMKQWFAIGEEPPILTLDAPSRFKGSVKFKKWLSACFDRYEKEYVPKSDFEPWEGRILQETLIRNWFYEEYQHYPLLKRRERVWGRIKRWLEMELDAFVAPEQRKEYKKLGNARLKTYQKKWEKITPFTLYKQFVNSLENPNLNFKKKEVEVEDLAPLLYIRNWLHGIQSEYRFDHVVIDEAQDFSPFQVAVLQEQTKGSSFTILGDLSQGIHAYQGILDWKEFMDLFKAEDQNFYQLVRSYRSTQEIIEFANQILIQSGESAALAKPVFRSGEPVKWLKVDPETRIEKLIETVHQLQSSFHSTAIVGRTDEECEAIYRELSSAGISASWIQATEREYRGGLSVVPIYLTKGLEFDAVVLVDVDAKHYLQNSRDAKLLYVGCTRALHELWIQFTEEVSPLLQNVSSEFYTSI